MLLPVECVKIGVWAFDFDARISYLYPSMRARPPLAAAFVALAAAVSASPAPAAQLIARNASDVKVAANAKGEALVTFRSGGKRRRLLAWGALNAVAPTSGQKQVAFRIDYAGGYGKYHRAIWRSFPNTCGRYTGPPLPWFVTACTATDGSHWALQSFQRMLRNYGLPSSGLRSAWELHLAHWTGDLPVLEVNLNWAYRRVDQLYGRFSYQGQPVYGFLSTRYGAPLDAFGRLLFLDTYNSGYGAGWHRDNSFLFHRPTGTFCYGLYSRRPGHSPMGRRYRATANGPGVTPIVAWVGDSPGPYNRELDLVANQEIRQLGDPKCPAN